MTDSQQTIFKEVYISFETAKLAKELGLPQNPYAYEFAYYFSTFTEKHYLNSALFNLKCSPIMAPSQSSLQKWLREKHNITVWVNKLQFHNRKYPFKYSILGYRDEYIISLKRYKTYEEALEQGLQKGLGRIKT